MPSIAQPPGTWNKWILYEQIARGERSVIALDDTAASGLPGAHPRRKAHAAIAVTRDKAGAVVQEMVKLWELLVPMCGVDYFHFKDVASANGPYRPLSMTQRLAILSRFVDLFNRYEIPIWLGQLDPETMQALSVPAMPADAMSLARRSGSPFRWDDPMTVTRFAVVNAAMKHLAENPSNLPASAFMDRVDGRLRDWCPMGTDQTGAPTPALSLLDPPAVMSDRSDFNPFVQLADFAAWSYTRLEIICARAPARRAQDDPPDRPGSGDWDRVVASILRPILAQHMWPQPASKWDPIMQIISVPFVPDEDGMLDGWWGRGMEVWRVYQLGDPPPGSGS